MRVLLAMTGPPGTGSGTVAEAVLDELTRQGHEAFLFYPAVVTDGRGGAGNGAGDPRHRVWPFPLRRGGLEIPSFPKMIPDPHPGEVGESLTCADLTPEELDLYLTSARDALGRVVDELAPDAVECHHLWSVSWAAAELGLDYVAVPHHSDQMGYRFDERMRPYAERAATAARHILPLSDFVRREVLELYPVAEEAVRTLPPGYDQDTFRPLPVSRAEVFAAAGIEAASIHSDPQAGDDLPIVGFSGKISHTKGVDVLLRANRRLQAERPCHLVVAGTGTLEAAFPDVDPTDFHLENVSFPGHVSHPRLARLHSASAVHVIPSREEGFGIAALEAMGCGAPLVASRVGGLPEFAVGELVPPEDGDALVDAVLSILNLGPEETRELRHRAREAALGYSWRRIVEERLEIYRGGAG